MNDNRDTMITVATRSTFTVTASLSLADQWERSKSYAPSIRYRVEEIRAEVDSAAPTERPSITLVGHRVLKDGRRTDRVRDRVWSLPADVPPGIWQSMNALITDWRAMA